MTIKEERELPSIPVLSNSNVVVIAAVFTGLCAVPTALLLQHVHRCSDRTCPPGSWLWTTPTMSAISQFISVTLLNYQRNTQMLPDISMLAISRFSRPTRSSRQSPSIMDMNKIMLASRGMEGRQVLQTTLVPSSGGW